MSAEAALDGPSTAIATPLSPPPVRSAQLTSLQDFEPPRQSAPPLNSPPPPVSEIQNIALHATPPTIPAHRSHDPSNNLKRSDPFQFGSRYLEEGDDVFEWNAWDHVDPSQDALFVEYSERQYAFQREHRLDAFDRRRFNAEPEKWWNKFYGNNKENFFKNRKWLQQEFPVLSACIAEPGSKGRQSNGTGGNERVKGPAREGAWVPDGNEKLDTILEVGAGAGNTAFPILKGNQNPKLMINACDFSKKAVELIRSNPDYDPSHIRAEVWDIASVTETLPPGVEEGSIDVVLLVFIFSALNPKQWAQAVRNVWKALRPGGEVCFRDYGRGDLAQVRFKKGRLLDENFYIRGDGTRVYFFDLDQLRRIWDGNLVDALPFPEKDVDGSAEESRLMIDDGSDVPAFEILALAADRRLLVNRASKLKMYRCWMQGRFRKPAAVTGT